MHRIFMKHFGFMAMLFFASIEVADGQAMIQVIPVEPEDETLIGSQSSIGWFGGPVLKFSEINDECAFFTGGCGGLVLKAHPHCPLPGRFLMPPSIWALRW